MVKQSLAALISGIVLGLLFGYTLHAFAQFGSPRLDERQRNWNEQQYQQRQENLRQENLNLHNEMQQWGRKPC